MSVPTISPADQPDLRRLPDQLLDDQRRDRHDEACNDEQPERHARALHRLADRHRPSGERAPEQRDGHRSAFDRRHDDARKEQRHQERNPARRRIACSRDEAGEGVAGQEAAPQPEREGSGGTEHDQADVERCPPHLVAGAEQQVEAGADQLARADDRRRFGASRASAARPAVRCRLGGRSGDVSACSIPVTRVRPAASRPPRPARRSGRPRHSRPTARPQRARRRRSGSALQGPRPARRPRPARAPA